MGETLWDSHVRHQKGKSIDTVSDYATTDGQTVHLTGARDVAEFAAGSEQAQKAFIEQLFHQLVKQPVLAYGHEVMDHLRESFVASGFNVQKLMVEIVTTAALHDAEKSTLTKKQA